MQVHSPVPLMPELQVPLLLHAFAAPPGHAWQLGPNKPGAHALQLAPTKPALQAQLPLAWAVPWPLQVRALLY